MKRDAYIAASESMLPANDSYRVSAAEICCSGDCMQGRLCPRYRKEETPMTRYDLITAVLIVVACALFVAFGPAFQSLIHRWFA